MAARVLIVEDEPEMQVILRDNLAYEGYQVISANTGEEGVRLTLAHRPDLVLLDVMLPNMSGYEVCRTIRASGCKTPVIMLTARNSEIDRVTGLEFGADDYVGKPFNVRELVARVRAQLRRVHYDGKEPDVLVAEDLTVDVRLREVRRGSTRVDMSSREFDLLRYLIEHRGEVVTRERLLNEVWGYNDELLTRTVDNFIVKLRKKIESNARRPRHIITVHGSGYRFLA